MLEDDRTYVLQISIPIGAVKRALILFRSGVVRRFQFQSVRLKALYRYLRARGVKIFQFQSVRLKEGPAQRSERLLVFQFQSVRLKGLTAVARS